MVFQNPKILFTNVPYHKFLLIKFSAILVFSALITTISLDSACTTYECRFSDYLSAHNITLQSPMERTYRFEIFKKNLQEIETFNESHPDIKLDLNDFGLLTRKEFKKTMTNPDFLFLDDGGDKHHVNVNDPRNEEVIAKHTVETNVQTLNAIKRQIAREGGGNALTMLEWDLEEATQEVDKELNKIHHFLEMHHHIQDDTELLDADGGSYIFRI